MKRALITGGSRGIGSHIVDAFTRGRNWHVVVLSRTKVPEDGVEWHNVDLADGPKLRQFLSETAPYDAVVLNAAIVGPQGPESKGDWHDVVQTNYVSNAVLAHNAPMNDGGRILAISSVHGATGVYGASAYASTKSALEGIVRSLALELAPRKIAVNAIRVGFVDAGMFRALSEKYRLLYRSRIPMGHIGDPSHFASFVHYLCTAPECSYITGQIIGYDGGYLANWWG